MRSFAAAARGALALPAASCPGQRRSFAAAAALLALFTAAPLSAGAAPFGPWGSPDHPVTVEAAFSQRLPRLPRDVVLRLEPQPLAARLSGRRPQPGSFDGHFLSLSFSFYRDLLTRVDGPRCAHSPVCSVYARDAVARHGLLGFGLGMDRLLRGNLDSPLRRLPLLVRPDGSLAFHDPVEYSAFFLEAP